MPHLEVDRVRQRRAGPHRPRPADAGAARRAHRHRADRRQRAVRGGTATLLHGCGTTDMKSGVAVLLHLAATVAEPSRDLTFVFYDCEEIEDDATG